MGRFQRDDEPKSQGDRFPFNAKGAKSDESSSKQNMVEVYDANGRKFLIPKATLVEKILPGQIKQNWNDPESLYGIILMAIEDGFAEEVIEAAEHQQSIDPKQERGSTILAIVYLKNQRYNDSQKVLEEYIAAHGKTGIIMTNLAKVYYALGKEELGEDTLWEGLEIDPNQDNGLPFWISLQAEKCGVECVPDMLKKVAKLPGSWLAQIYLASNALARKDLDEAMYYYRSSMLFAQQHPGVLYRISGDLGRFGFTKASIEKIAPLYRPELDDIRTGLNLLSAYKNEKLPQEGLKLVAALRKLDRKDISDHLDQTEKDFRGMMNVPDNSPEEPKVTFTLSLLDKPVWYYGLSDPKWLVPTKTLASKIGFLAFSDATVRTGDTLSAIREDESGRLTRSLPLYLAEGIQFFSGMQPVVMIPVAMNIGPVVTNQETDEEQMLQLCGKHNLDYILTGSLYIDGGIYNIKTILFSREKKQTEQITTTSNEKDIALSIRRLQIQLHERIGSPLPKDESTRVGHYTLPGTSILIEYLSALGQSLIQTLATNQLIDVQTIRGETNILDAYLRLAAKSPGNLINEAILVSGLAKSKNYGSDQYKGYQKSTLMQLRAGKNENDNSLLLPAAYRLFARLDEATLVTEATRKRIKDTDYIEWLTQLES